MPLSTHCCSESTGEVALSRVTLPQMCQAAVERAEKCNAASGDTTNTAKAQIEHERTCSR